VSEQAPSPEQAPRRPRRWRRWVLLGSLGILLTVLVLLVGAIVYFQTSAGNARLLHLALGAASQALAGHLEARSLVLRGGHLILRDVTLETDEGERVAHVDEIELQLALSSLLHKTLRLERVRILHPQLWLVQDDERGLNLARAIAPREPKPPQPPSGPPSLTFAVDSLQLESGAVEFVQGRGDGARHVRLSGLGLGGHGRYVGPSGALEGTLEGRGSLHEPLTGPLRLKASARGDGRHLEGSIDLGLAGLLLVASGRQDGSDHLEAKLEKLVVPPAVGRAFVPGWSVRVPVELRGQGGLAGTRARASLQGSAGSTRLGLEADADVRAKQVHAAHVALSHVNLAELLKDGPSSDLALTVDATGGGTSLETLTGKLDASMPQSRIRGAQVGPVELHASADRGTFALSQLQALLPGLRLDGRGGGTRKQMTAKFDVQATDLAALGRTFGRLSDARMPPLSGQGRLHLEARGPLEHPGILVDGAFSSLRMTDTEIHDLRLGGSMADIDKPLDANAQISVSELKLGDRSFRHVDAGLLTRGRALDLHLITEGFVHANLHLGGTLDGDRRGLGLSELTVHFPEADWALEKPAHVRFAGDLVQVVTLSLRSGEQQIALNGWKRGNRLEATASLQAIDLTRLPRALLPKNTKLGGKLTVDARARGTTKDPAVEASFDVVDVQVNDLQHLFLKGNAGWAGRRARAKLTAKGLGTELSADVDVPVEGLEKRRHLPLHAQIRMPAFDAGQVLCAAVRAKLLAQGCRQDGTPELTGQAQLDLDLSGYADAPALKAVAQTRAMRFRQLPPADLKLQIDGSEREDLAVALEGTALQGKVDARGSVGMTLGRLVSQKRPAEALRTVPLKAQARLAGLQLKPLHEARLVTRDISGAIDLRADVAGTVAAPTGDVHIEGHRLVTPPMQPTELAVDIKAHQRINVGVEAQDTNGKLIQLALDVGASPAQLQQRSSYDDVTFKLDGTIGPIDLSKLPVKVGGEGRLARSLRGTAEAKIQGRGSLQSPVLNVHATTTQLAAADVPLGKGDIDFAYQSAKSRLQADLRSVNGGSLRLDSSLTLDASYPAVRRGLQPANAPFQAQLVAQQFDVSFLTGFTAILRKVGGTIDADARGSGTLSKPQAQGKLEMKNGTVSLAGYGQYQRVHLAAQASNDHFGLDDLEAHTENSTLKAKASADRSGNTWALKANAEATNFPIISEDQLVATASLRTDLTGQASPGMVQLDPVRIPEAHIELPAQSRKDLQSLQRPDDIILLRGGVPVDPKRAREVLARDPTVAGNLKDVGALPPQTKPTEVVIVLDAPRNLWVKSPDLNIEVGLGNGFRIETGEDTNIFGEVRVLRGRLDVLGRRFDIQRNSVVRFGGPPTEPALDVTAIYTNVKEGVKVFMHVQGQGKDIALMPSSEPPLTEAEIYTLLATGRTSLKRGGGGSEVGSAQVSSVVGALAAAQLKSAVGDKVGLDVLSVESGDTGGIQGSSLEAGKYLTDEVYLGYQAKVGADPTKYENANAVRLEYQFKPRWSFEAAYGDAGSGSADIVWSRDY
jgi:translocation and assembly module TamB